MKRKAIAQKQIWHEYGYQNYLKEFGEMWDLTEVNVIPFTTTLQPEPDFVPELVMGSGRLVSIARERGWPSFPSYDPIEPDIFPKEYWMNRGGWKSTIGECFNMEQDMFVKPYTEKLFTASIVPAGRSLFSSVQLTKTYEECENEKVWVNYPQKINEEIRFFVVGGQVITGSLYKESGVAQYAQIDNRHIIWEVFSELLPTCKQKDLTAVVDVTYVDGQILIIEMNNLNSAGVYASDYAALARALYNYEN